MLVDTYISINVLREKNDVIYVVWYNKEIYESVKWIFVIKGMSMYHTSFIISTYKINIIYYIIYNYF